MSDLVITVDEAKLLEVTQLLGGVANGLPRALAGAVNDTVKREKTQISAGIRAKINIKKRDLDPKIGQRWASLARPQGAVSLSAYRRISLTYFGARKTAKGVTYKIAKDGQRKSISDAFGIDGPDLSRGVFKRVGKSRLPIRKLFGPSPLAVFFRAGMDFSILADASRELYANLDRRVRYLLLKARGQL